MSQDDLCTSSFSSRSKKVIKTFPSVASLHSAQDEIKPFKKDPIPVFPSLDVGAEQTPPPQPSPPYTPPTVDIQEVELDAYGEHQFMISVIISPEEIQPFPMIPNVDNLYCEVCERSFHSKNGLAMHMKTSIDHKIIAVSQGKSAQCNSSEQEILSRIELLYHFELKPTTKKRGKN